MISTERLNIKIASDDEMRALIAAEEDAELKKAYGEMLSACLACPGERQWTAAWFIELKSGERIGDLCFKGLSADGVTEIGYGLLPAFWGKGYATEAVKAVAAWALSQPKVTHVEAETEPDNAASQRVLAKAGFVPTGTFGEEGPRYIL